MIGDVLVSSAFAATLLVDHRARVPEPVGAMSWVVATAVVVLAVLALLGSSDTRTSTWFGEHAGKELPL